MPARGCRMQLRRGDVSIARILSIFSLAESVGRLAQRFAGLAERHTSDGARLRGRIALRRCIGARVDGLQHDGIRRLLTRRDDLGVHINSQGMGIGSGGVLASGFNMECSHIALVALILLAVLVA